MPSPNLHLTYRDGGTGDAGDPYTGLDRFGRLVETLWKQPGTGDPGVQSKYGRNQVGGVVWRKDEQAHAQDVSTEDNYYWYDALQQVKQHQRGDLTDPASIAPISDVQQEEDWAYDATGNWAAYSNTNPTNGQTRTHNTANEITEISAAPGDVEPAYDPVGNMLTLPKEPGLSTDQYDLVWDAWNRLVAVKDGGTTVASYTYDGLTRRQTKTNAAETRHYYYNAQWRAVEERVDGASVPVDRQYTWGLRDRWDMLRRKRSVSGSLDETLFLLRDYLDPAAIVDETGAVVERYAYDAFGNVRFLAPDYTSRSTSDFDWNFLFHAEFQDSDTGLYSYGYRYYSPSLGRWLSRDPMGEAGGMNLFVITNNNCISIVDMLGLVKIDQGVTLDEPKFRFDLAGTVQPFPGIDQQAHPQFPVPRKTNAVTAITWDITGICEEVKSIRSYCLKNVDISFTILVRIKPALLKDPKLLSTIKDEYDHVLDWIKWVNDGKSNEGALKKIREFRKGLRGFGKRYPTRDACLQGAKDDLTKALGPGALNTLIKTLEKYDLPLENPRHSMDPRPRRLPTTDPRNQDPIKPFPYGFLP